jgi:type II secretory ATPase GspE/PulE/Tfp pilus assembly ATPase PilB-like protein
MSNPLPPKKPISSVPATLDPHTGIPGRAPVYDRRASDVLAAADNPEIAFRGQKATANTDENVDIQDYSVDQPVIIQMVNKLISDAIAHRASDIHFEPVRDGIIIKYRIDGTLYEWDRIAKGFANSTTSRIKIMAEMNIAERRVPQDGRITVRTGGRTVDMRVSSLPSQHGEAIVLRILDRSIMRLDIEHLGFGDRNLRTLKTIIKKPHGIFLATGPTGSGKTTTLYAALHAIQSPDINIITVEDPIEYELTGVRQSNTNEKAGLTFPKQLRAILRQDPDVIYVGEIRDSETAEIAFRAALTGHLVFSTLHCNEASSAITRLLNMDVDPFLIASSVTGVLAQRLVRRICPSCSRPYTPTIEELGLLGLDPMSAEVKNANFRMGEGCEQCNGSGYIGRCSVQEIMVMDENIRALTLQQTPSSKIRQTAASQGSNHMITMRADAAAKVMQGLTTTEEVQKRVMLDDD